MKINKNWFVWWIVEMSIVVIIIAFILLALFTISTDAYKKYNSYRIKNFVLEENAKIQKALSWIRFGEWIKFIDETPVNHPELSNIIVQFPDSEQIEFRIDDLWADDISPTDFWPNWLTSADSNDFSFFNNDNQEIYVYNKDIIEIRKMNIIPLDPNINRWWVLIHLELWADWRNNQLAARMFWNNEYFMEYNIVYTFRNTAQED